MSLLPPDRRWALVLTAVSLGALVGLARGVWQAPESEWVGALEVAHPLALGWGVVCLALGGQSLLGAAPAALAWRVCLTGASMLVAWTAALGVALAGGQVPSPHPAPTQLGYAACLAALLSLSWRAHGKGIPSVLPALGLPLVIAALLGRLQPAWAPLVALWSLPIGLVVVRGEVALPLSARLMAGARRVILAERDQLEDALRSAVAGPWSSSGRGGTSPHAERVGVFVALTLVLGLYLLLGLTGEPIIQAEGFIERSREPLFSIDFFTSWRPFTTDLFYKLCGSRPRVAVIGQQVMNVLGWTSLGLGVACCLRHPAVWRVALGVLASGALWWNIAGWTPIMRSESLSLSLLALWLGVLLGLHRFRQRRWLVGVGAATLFFSFTRDNLPLFLGVLAVGWGALVFALKGRVVFAQRRLVVPVVVIFIGVAGLQTLSASVAARHQFNLINVVFQRILPDTEKRAWFVEHGMPLPADLLSLQGRNAGTGNERVQHRAVWNDPTYRPFEEWTRGPGKTVYALYLLTHPTYTLTSAWEERDKILAANLYLYTSRPPPMLGVRAVEWLWGGEPRVLWTSLALALGCLGAFTFVTRSWLLTFPPLLWVASVTNALFVYHADSIDIPRHCVMVVIGLEVVFFLSAALLVDLGLRLARIHLRRRQQGEAP